MLEGESYVREREREREKQTESRRFGKEHDLLCCGELRLNLALNVFGVMMVYIINNKSVSVNSTSHICVVLSNLARIFMSAVSHRIIVEQSGIF